MELLTADRSCSVKFLQSGVFVPSEHFKPEISPQHKALSSELWQTVTDYIHNIFKCFSQQILIHVINVDELTTEHVIRLLFLIAWQPWLKCFYYSPTLSFSFVFFVLRHFPSFLSSHCSSHFKPSILSLSDFFPFSIIFFSRVLFYPYFIPSSHFILQSAPPLPSFHFSALPIIVPLFLQFILLQLLFTTLRAITFCSQPRKCSF